MNNFLTIPTAAPRDRAVTPCAVSTVASELISSTPSMWCAPIAVTGGSALGTAAFGYGAHDVSVAQMSANALIDTRSAAKLTRPPRGTPR